MKPIYAQGYYFLVPFSGKWRVQEVINYYYLDEEGKLAELVHRPLEYEEEVLRVQNNMQAALLEEDVRINGVKAEPVVLWTVLEFLAFAELPYYTFFIEFEGPAKDGENCFENRYESWVAEYDYEAYWYLPPGFRFTECSTSCDYEVTEDGRILSIWCRRGDRIKGYERICWEKKS